MHFTLSKAFPIPRRETGGFFLPIYTPQQIAETLYFPLRCVDALQREGLSHQSTGASTCPATSDLGIWKLCYFAPASVAK
ncbi:MAG TPA: hypothetical protein V6D16_10560, partial [Candidatus Obscuribacterales bacterium]